MSQPTAATATTTVLSTPAQVHHPSIAFGLRLRLILFVGMIVGVTACSGAQTSPGPEPSVPTAQTAAVEAPSAAVPPPTQSAAAPQANFYTEGLNRASSAFSISQSAQSTEDWQLAASRWQQAISLMESVPAASTDSSLAQQKIKEYQTNLTVAQQQVRRLESSVSSPSPSVISASGGAAPPSSETAPATSSEPTAPPATEQASLGSTGAVYQAPILNRSGGTPVIQVKLNGRPFEMIVDTGASGTVITQDVATALGVQPVGQASVNTASAKDVPFDIGYVESIEVNGAVLKTVPVAIGPDLEIGLLGNDFFGRYDVTIRATVVEFRER